MPDVDWKSMTDREFNAAMSAGRKDGERRMRELQEALGMIEAPKGPGRPKGSRNGATQLTAADLEEADA
jgi:hypothetical protein